VITRILLTYKQHRFEVVATLVLCVGVTVAAIIEALRLNAVHLPAGCDPYSSLYGGPDAQISVACRTASNQWLAIRNGWEMNFIRPLPQVLPFVVGIMLGAPLVAREIETGTAPLSWALAGSRRRWLAARMIAIVLLIVPLLLALGLAADSLEGATVHGLNPWANFIDYMNRGVPIVFWGLAAFAGTVALGTLVGRTMPAIVLAVVVCLLARGTWEAGMNHFVLAGSSQILPSAADVQRGTAWSQASNSDLVTRLETYLDGQPWSGDANLWWQEHITQTVDQFGNVTTSSPVGPEGQPIGPYGVPFGFHGNMYWPIVAIESAILFLGSLLCGAVALVWVERRRPY
jgi:hypothetical protein